MPVLRTAGNYNLYLQFQLKNRNPKHDVSIWINDIQNKLSSKSHIYYNENTTFSYTMTLPSSQTSVPVIFGKGDYELTDIQCYTGAEKAFTKDMSESHDLYQPVFQSDHKQTKGNHHIVILYHSPGVKIGRLLSLMGMVLAIVCVRPQRRWFLAF